jgi:hypothetical protein
MLLRECHSFNGSKETVPKLSLSLGAAQSKEARILKLVKAKELKVICSESHPRLKIWKKVKHEFSEVFL